MDARVSLGALFEVCVYYFTTKDTEDTEFKFGYKKFFYRNAREGFALGAMAFLRDFATLGDIFLQYFTAMGAKVSQWAQWAFSIRL